MLSHSVYSDNIQLPGIKATQFNAGRLPLSVYTDTKDCLVASAKKDKVRERNIRRDIWDIKSSSSCANLTLTIWTNSDVVTVGGQSGEIFVFAEMQQKPEVKKFIKKHSLVRSCVEKTYDAFRKYLPDAKYSLEVVTDPEELDVQLVLFVELVFGSAEQIDKFYKFDSEWSLKKYGSVKNLFLVCPKI